MHENLTEIRIRIKDINDLPPKFDKPSYETTVFEELPLPDPIIKVTLPPPLFPISLFMSHLHTI